jgi:hypothetical protein
MARVLFDVGNQTSIEDGLAIGGGVQSAVEVERRARKLNALCLSIRFKAFNPSGSKTVSASLTGAMGIGTSYD